MVQINDDYYEDLTPESTVSLLEALKKSAVDTVGAAGTTQLPGAGPMSGRQSCENSKGLTNLTGEPWGKEMMRTDGEL